MRKICLYAFVCFSLILFVNATIWEGAAAADSKGELPENELCMATNAFPVNSLVEVTNLDNGKTVRVIAVSALDAPGLLAILSKEAANRIGLQSKSLSRIRISQGEDSAVSSSRVGSEFSASGDPDYDPSVFIAINGYGFYEDKADDEKSVIIGTDRIESGELIVDMPGYPVKSVEEEIVEAPIAEEPIAEEPIVEEVMIAEAEPEETPVEEAIAEEPIVEEVFIAEAETEPEETSVEEAIAEEPLVEEVLITEAEPEITPEKESLVEEILITEAEPEEILAEEILKEDTVMAYKIKDDNLIAVLPEEIPDNEYIPENITAIEDMAEPDYMLALIPAETRPPEESISIDEYNLLQSVNIEEIDEEIDPAYLVEAIDDSVPGEDTTDIYPVLAAEQLPIIPEESVIEVYKEIPVEHAVQLAEEIHEEYAAKLPVETPKVEAPKIETAKVEASRVEAPKAEIPGAAAPEYAPPRTSVFSVPLISSLEKGKYYLQIAAFSKEETVESELAKIDNRLPRAVMNAGTAEKPVYRILIGPVNLGESGALLQRFKLDFKDAFIRQGT